MWAYVIVKYYDDGKSENCAIYKSEIAAKEYVEKMNENRPSPYSPFYFVQPWIMGE